MEFNFTSLRLPVRFRRSVNRVLAATAGALCYFMLPSVANAQVPTYCTTTLHSVACGPTDNINTVSIAGTTLNNANTGCSGASAYMAYPATGATTATLLRQVTYNLSVTSTANSIISVWIDYNQNGTFEPSEWQQMTTSSTAGTAVTTPITIPNGALLGQTGMRIRSRFSGNANGAGDACTTMGSGETEDYIVTIGAAPVCSGTPTAGTVSGNLSVCSGQTSTLSLSGQTLGTTLQWQSSLNGTTWADISGATGSTYVAGPLTANTFYRVNVTCNANTVATPSVQVALNNGAIATFPHTQNFDGVTAPALPCGWTVINANGDTETWETTTSNPSTPPNALYYSYNSASAADDWAFSPAIAMAAGTSYQVTFKYRVQSGTYPENLEVKWGNAATVAAMTNTVFTGSNLTNTTYVTATATISPATAGNYNIGFHVYSAADMWNLFIDDVTITALTACTGAPVAGTVPASPMAICAGNVNTITATGAAQGSGISYQWEEATSAAGPWTNAVGGSGATTTTYTLPALTSTRFYRLKVTCAGSGQMATTSAVEVTVNPVTACYCNTNLHSVACDPTDNINTVSIAGTTLNNANTGCSGASAYMAYPATGSTTATLLRQVTYNLNVTSTASSILSVWIDYNQNGVFEASEWQQITTSSTANAASSVAITIPATAVLGQTGMRIRSRLSGNQNGAPDACLNMGSGETEDYIITIGAAPVCSGTPTAGTITGAQALCPGQTATLTLNGQTLGTTLQWQSSPNNTTWTDITGATSVTYTAGPIAASTYYRVNVTCGTSTVATPSVQATFTSGAVSTFPHTQNFDGVTVPAIPCGWTITDSNSDGFTWFTNSFASSSTPNSLVYSYNSTTNTIGANDWAFSPALTLTAGKQYVVTFKYRADAATWPEGLEIKFGNAATAAGMTSTVFTNTNITNNTFVTGTATAFTPTATGTYYLGLHAISAPDMSALFIDDVVITEVTPCTAPAKPTITVAAGGSTTFCQGGSVSMTGASTTAGVTYKWSRNGAPIAGATTASYTATTAGNYRIIASVGTCSDSSNVTTVTVNPKPAMPTITKTGNMLTASVTTGTYQWYSVSGTTLTAVAGATSQTFTPATNGDYTVKVTVNGCESDAATAMNVVLGISSLAPGMDVSIYPNPTAGKFEVNLIGFDKEAAIQIISVTGQVISETKVAVTSKDKTSQLFNLNGMAKGVYILKVTSGDNLTFRKVVLD